MLLLRLTVFILFVAIGHQWNTVVKSKGAVWPLPQHQLTGLKFYSLNGSTFKFAYNGPDCPILDNAFERYYSLIFKPPRLPKIRKNALRHTDSAVLWKSYIGSLDQLKVSLSGKCEVWPHYDMEEQYELYINTSGWRILESSSVWGILRGLETFSHLAYRDEEFNIFINTTSIIDFPRFPHRGVMLDTSRHYLPKAVILKNLDAMTYNKYNVLHWHIVDDQSFPYQSQGFPSLSEKGAYVSSTHIYHMNDVVEVIDYARQRGIRVIVEFDTPAHTESWGYGMPDLLTPCFKNESGRITADGYGPINPIANSTYTFLNKFMAEVTHLFPDVYFHIGGDEVSFECWASNPSIQNFMKLMNFGSNYSLLQNYYIKNVLGIMSSTGKNAIVWEEVFYTNVTLDPNTVVHVWKDSPMDKLKDITASGHQALLSTCWYLSNFQMANDWIEFYLCEPLAFNGTDEEYALVIGGEACMWGEYVDSTNLISRLWPRALAPAERLWSNETVNNHTIATPRFEEHRCRMVQRGINAEPVNGPSFCPSDYLV